MISLLFIPFFSFSLELTPLNTNPYTGDLDELTKKGIVRVLVSEDLGFYYVEGGKPKGMLAEVLHHFEKELKKKHTSVHIQIIPVTRDDLIPALNAGFGDVIVANLTKTTRREQTLDFSTPMISNIKEFLVTHSGEPELVDIDQLSGKEIWVRPSSSYFESIQSINEYLILSNLAPINVHFFDEALQDYEIVEMVNQGYIYSTVLDSHKVELWLGVMDNIKIHENLPLRSGAEISWAFRKNSPQLEKQVNSFLRTAKAGTLLGNVLYDRYILNSKWLSRALSPDRIKRMQSLTNVFEKYSEQYDFDWLMVSAQAFQESGLDNSLVSHKGAVGIMQVLPSTAADPNVNIKDIKQLDNNVHAGVKYMRFITDRYFSDDEITRDNQVYLSLAAYNAGPANIRKMRRLAVKHGYDPNIWFKNVEIITRRNIGREPVNYVANINRYFVIYKQLEDMRKLREEKSAALLKLVAPE
ncbi:MltF family protein [Vibrio algarum]|uniref:Lytic transglycosylase F n=1 Tax=Vibrio algarum TaxID=3020714 RepID=A0ABT4YTA4_9VIBR|nr:lytic transglycosylase F [Vibrio sp. KJ40-1]MDB1124796.1 lytic transglycosylase F [Vibrio sp. KJ40-1]